MSKRDEVMSILGGGAELTNPQIADAAKMSEASCQSLLDLLVDRGVLMKSGEHYSTATQADAEDPARKPLLGFLASGPKSPSEIGAFLELSPEDTRKALRRAKHAGVVEVSGMARGARWSLASGAAKAAPKPREEGGAGEEQTSRRSWRRRARKQRPRGRRLRRRLAAQGASARAHPRGLHRDGVRQDDR